MPTKAALSLSFATGRGRENVAKRLGGQVKDEGITQQLSSWAEQTQFGEIIDS